MPSSVSCSSCRPPPSSPPLTASSPDAQMDRVLKTFGIDHPNPPMSPARQEEELNTLLTDMRCLPGTPPITLSRWSPPVTAALRLRSSAHCAERGCPRRGGCGLRGCGRGARSFTRITTIGPIRVRMPPSPAPRRRRSGTTGRRHGRPGRAAARRAALLRPSRGRRCVRRRAQRDAFGPGHVALQGVCRVRWVSAAVSGRRPGRPGRRRWRSGRVRPRCAGGCRGTCPCSRGSTAAGRRSGGRPGAVGRTEGARGP